MRIVVYYFFKVVIKTGLFFYSQKIKVNGANKIPKDGAVLFTSNHPNGLIDPLLIATHIKRKTHFLVRAAVFKNKLVASFFDLLGMMPVYRIRDGVNQLSKNEAIFNKCEQILKSEGSLLIFPEGTHNKKRTIRPLSKGFTRIIFQTLDNTPSLQLYIVPVGITYQNIANYPAKVALNFGSPIDTSIYTKKENRFEATKEIKDHVSEELKKLIVHIPEDENYEDKLQMLNNARIDFTQTKTINKYLNSSAALPPAKKTINYIAPLLFLIKLNSIIPYSIWKLVSRKIDEVEFIDTFRFGFNIILFPLFYLIQSFLISLFFDQTIGLYYLLCSFIIVLCYSKFSSIYPK
ncbi:lysophospholipid acyltransferase family protein [Tenacibaculum sp. TC6]|uniref:lysophospholipid acyltransferase family protein n=1 Tax=Tenacibaculum sp. TC6 TaxID=3423223 RepID=UPI003D360506